MVKILTNEELREMGLSDYYYKEYTFIKLRGKLLNIGKRKPGIERTIYYDDETPCPKISYNFFEDYNMKRAFGNLLNDEFFDIDLYFYKTNNIYYEFTSYLDWIREPKPEILTADEKKQILEVIEILKKDYRKRLKTYYKKYANKIYTHGYWANR